eukprot:SAG31_NODE_176_length_21334_cov_12.211067_3_plen_186_part_00
MGPSAIGMRIRLYIAVLSYSNAVCSIDTIVRAYGYAIICRSFIDRARSNHSESTRYTSTPPRVLLLDPGSLDLAQRTLRQAGEKQECGSAGPMQREWIVFTAKGKRAPDGSNNASIVGLIASDGCGEDYPDLTAALGADSTRGLTSWQIGTLLPMAHAIANCSCLGMCDAFVSAWRSSLELRCAG